MILNNEQLVNTTDILSVISNKQLPIKISYAFTKNIRNINAELKIYNEEKQKLIDRYSVKDANGRTLIEDGKIQIQNEYISEWNMSIKELLMMENEININKVNINELLNSNCDFSPSELMQINYMIEEE